MGVVCLREKTPETFCLIYSKLLLEFLLALLDEETCLGEWRLYLCRLYLCLSLILRLCLPT
jgi:hypothetical protein